ncbi:MAG: YihY/virulence factor BrkB family protein [Flavobacteriales bacterium]|nr:YihY/virulence factor BrkB family protein [Flavobacteriales bacterium]
MFALIKNISKKFKPWGFEGLSIYDVTIFFWKGLMEGAITTRASSLAFNFFLAFFPAVIFLFTLIPYIPIEGFQETLMELLGSVLPESTNKMAFKTIDDIVNNPRGGLLSVGFVLALYFSTNGVSALIEAFNSSFHIRESRSFLYQRFISLVLTLILSVMLIFTISTLIFGKSYLGSLLADGTISTEYLYLFSFLRWFIMFTFLLFGISLLFYLAPNLQVRWKLFSPGTIFSSLFIIITSIIFSYYINNFAQYNQIYGSIGTLIIILLWMYFNSIILLTGFEINASIIASKKHCNSNSDL